MVDTDYLIIEGGFPLRGRVRVSGSKNAALPILAATLLTDESCTIENVPDLEDIDVMRLLLKDLGVEADRDEDGKILTRLVDEKPYWAPWEKVKMMRASFCVLGPLIAKRGRARVSYPGGCVIGTRPVDLHLKGLKSLGARIEIEHGDVFAEAKRLQGGYIYLGGAAGSSVTGTANVLMAAVLAHGKTILENAACEPEIEDLAEFLRKMGAKIRGAGTPKIEVVGVDALHGACHRVIPDRIEAGTLVCAAAATGGEVTIDGICLEHMGAVADRCAAIGIPLKRHNGSVTVQATEEFRPVDITTLPYPGFPTDLQAQFTAVLTLTRGISVVTERIYPDRFIHVAEMNRMGAQIRREGPSAIIQGVPRLSGAQVTASDLRASAALVLAALIAKGTTEVHRIYHLDRGYQRFEEKLQALGASIQRIRARKREPVIV
ncbi:MAG: UDP-N-acetylglucosamine 1-carboxyvinyltransferase [Planctomycetota bacterium]